MSGQILAIFLCFPAKKSRVSFSPNVVDHGDKHQSNDLRIKRITFEIGHHIMQKIKLTRLSTKANCICPKKTYHYKLFCSVH